LRPASRSRRIDFYKRAIETAGRLGSDCVSLWSGVVRDRASDDEVWQRLVPALEETLDHAQKHSVAIGFEPEPDMFIDTMSRYSELLAQVDSEQLRLTLDVGHLHCQGETPIAERIAQVLREEPRVVPEPGGALIETGHRVPPERSADEQKRRVEHHPRDETEAGPQPQERSPGGSQPEERAPGGPHS
jgi:hypothetical protein